MRRILLILAIAATGPDAQHKVLARLQTVF
jgi:hypothetical protein